MRQEELQHMDCELTTSIKSASCVVRGIDGQPVKVRPGRHNVESVEIEPLRGDHDRPLWFPRNLVLECDEDLYAALDDAYRRNDIAELARLWACATQWQPQTILPPIENLS